MGFTEYITSKLISQKPTPPISVITQPYSIELSSGKTIVVDSTAEPTGKKTTPSIKRVDKAELEAVYHVESNMFNAINKTYQLIMSAGYRLIGDAKSVKFFENFFASIGSRGGELEWDELLTSIFKYQLIYGESWVEKIPAKRDSEKIVDLQLIDPKKMDYAKDSNYNISLDPHQNPIGYVETLPTDYTMNNSKNPPKEVSLESNQIFFLPNQIAHFKLYTVGDAFYPIGIIEPAYQTIVRKLNMEQALANSVDRNGFPRLLIEIGDDNHEPTEEMIQKAVTKIKDLNYMGVIGHPYWMKTKMVEASNPEKLQQHLEYYTDQICTATGLPKALVTGLGAETNRATLNRQESLAKLTLKDTIKRTLKVMEKEIIEPVAKSNGVNPVKILWGEISIEELDGKAVRLTKYAQAGLLVPDKGIESLLRKFEDLPAAEDPDAITKAREVKPKEDEKKEGEVEVEGKKAVEEKPSKK